MVIKVYVSLTSGNFQIKNKQEKVRQVLDTLRIEYEEMDISDPMNDEKKSYMKENTPKKEGQQFVLPPQIFNDDIYCGDFEDFEQATEIEDVPTFLKLEGSKSVSHGVTNGEQVNGAGDH